MQYMFKVLNTKYRNNFDSNKRYPNMENKRVPLIKCSIRKKLTKGQLTSKQNLSICIFFIVSLSI